jgi:hypothetical protein
MYKLVAGERFKVKYKFATPCNRLHDIQPGYSNQHH